MLDQRTPAWLRTLERKLSWLAVPNIAILFVTLQAAGFFFVMSDPIWLERLALIPSRVLQGEPWRLVTFLSLPLSLSPIFVLFVLWFLYFIVNLIEDQWGAFKTTFYVLVSILITIAYSFAFNYPVTNVTHFQSTLFLAAAALFPEFQVNLFFVLPVKMRWLAWLTLGFLALELLRGTWLDRGYLLAIYSNYLLFFGPAYAGRFKNYLRKRDFDRRAR